MSPYKSSSTLQNSVYSYSFSKQERFSGIKINCIDSIYNLPETKSLRFTSQGFGNKLEMINPTGLGSPPPNSYRLKSCFENSIDKKKGPLFMEKFSPLVSFYFLFLNINKKAILCF
jgi:hypothetical protein